MADFKKDVPVDRTVVPGTWSDVLDDWSDSFITDGTSQNVVITNLSELLVVMTQAVTSLECSNIKILTQLELLNTRIEEAFATGIDKGDL